MVAHRAHPITGPWPFATSAPWAAEHGTTSPGDVPLAHRVPLERSVIYADPDDALLFDGCVRCEQQAAEPLHLDPVKLGRVWSHMVAVEIRDEGYYRTAAERQVCMALYGLALIIERTHRGIDPWRWPWTYRVEAPHVSGSIPLDVPATIDADLGDSIGVPAGVITIGDN